jgi:two-component system, NarL family, response regulator NreC
MKRISVVIADDHAVLRTGLRMMIDAEPDMKTLGEAADGAGLLEIVRKKEPDVALVDFTMPETDAIQMIGQIVKEHPRTRVVVLTMHEDALYLDAALAAGASGYVVKSAADSEVLSAIRAVHGGRTFVDAGKTRAGGDGGSPRATAGVTRRALSRRERQVLVLVGQGYTNKEVAAQIGVGEKTVETYRARVAEKLDLHSRADFVRYALDLGLLTAGEGRTKLPDR